MSGDPQTEVYVLKIFRTARDAHISTHSGDTDVEAIAALTQTWTAINDAEKVAWNAQVERDAAMDAEKKRLDQERAEAAARALLLEQEAATREEMKKHRAKYVPILDQPIPDEQPILASPFVLRKVEASQYFELWYFTTEGLQDAKKSVLSGNDNTLTFVTENGVASLQATSSARESRAVISDRSLTWDQFCIATARVLQAMERANCTKEHVEMFLHFWSNIQTHPFRYKVDPDGLYRKALLSYQDTVRRNWFYTISQPNPQATYSIARINEKVLQDTFLEVERDHRIALDRSFEFRRYQSLKDYEAQGHSRGRHRSRSPPRRAPYGSSRREASRSPSPNRRRFRKGEDFPRGASSAPPACAICLGERNTIFGNANDLVHGMVPTLLSPSESATTSSSNPPSKPSASTGRFAREAASAPPTPNVICALDASPSPTEPSDALALRLRQINCIYPASTWSAYLDAANLSEKYPYLVSGFRFGFIFDFPSISVTQTPPNKFSTPELATEFTKIVRSELQKDRYIGPFSRASLESHLGPFQTSPFSLIPKAGKPGKFRAIQNFSFPPVVSPAFPNPSINSFTSAVNFPCTWGSFAVASFLLGNLPPGSRIATRDVAEAFRSVPLHPSQYPAAVVRVGEDEFCVDTCGAFGARPSGGVYGHIQDAAVDIFRSQGIGPITKWVDDHIFAQVPVASLVSYNTFRASVRTFFASNGPHHAGGRLCLFAYNMEDVDDLSRHLGIPWESSKDVPFSSAALYIGLLWDLSTSSVSLSPKKTEKYLAAIAEWSKRSTHSLDDVQQLYGKLLHASLVIPEGRAYLTGLETMLGSYGDSVLSSRHPPRSICGELDWWSASLRNSSLSRPIPLPKELVDIQAFSDASSGVGIAIVIGQHWRAWRLIPGWRTLNGSRDIGWAEAVGFELLIYAIAGSDESRRSFKLFGDNKGVVEGWWNNRSRNSAVNSVFRRIHTFLAASDRRESFFSAYVSTKLNPADAPSRGLYPSSAFLLAPIPIPTPLAGLIIDFDAPRTAKELQSVTPLPLPKLPPDLATASARTTFNSECFSTETFVYASQTGSLPTSS
ncbi:hypothetical protein D9613_009325 [Agrocybe pediades]|uniref:Uncharacterized protein n=1 Tax=Agrocybe pediades TaxID=84607 RepID=A0A8H4R3E2_9AGAR|nr:hypothetical protein D9613_009325 [Agrocybe pediades]